MFLAIVLAVAEIFGLFSIGAVAKFFGYIDNNDVDRWSRLVVDFLLPAFIFNSITSSFESQRFYELWPLPLLGLGLVVFWTLIGFFLRGGLLSKDCDLRRSFLHFCAVNNSAYLPIVIIRNFWGEAALANLFLFNLGTTIGVWTIGVSVLGPGNWRKSLKNLLTPNLCAVLAATTLSVTGFTRYIPPVITRIIASAGSAAVPSMLILIGASLAYRSAIRISWPVVYITIIRLVLLPALAICGLQFLNISADVYRIAVIVSLMPVAVS
ncbi:MAG: hypothetical protein GX640_06495, partial [Fibrobacter sp.]|nr:hypothetical protein [Fibrobacter sp.]